MILHPIGTDSRRLAYLEPWEWLRLREQLQRWGIPTKELDALEAGGTAPDWLCLWIAGELRDYFGQHPDLLNANVHRIGDLAYDSWLRGRDMLPAVLETLEVLTEVSKYGGMKIE